MPKGTVRDGSNEAKPAGARLAALTLMGQALTQIDSDSTIPAIVGARLQAAIDTLERCSPSDLPLSSIEPISPN
jgi:hypothetical protein